jgi:hypothetical protein
MIQKQLSLPDELHQQIKRRAELANQSEEHVMQELLAQALGAGGKTWRNSGEALLTLSELGIAGPADLAENHDADDATKQP